MRVAVSHTKSKDEVKQIIDKSANDLLTMPLGSAQIIDPQRRWDGDTMKFSFVGRQSIFKATIAGAVEVTDHEVVLNVDLPPLIKSFVPEDKVRGVIENKVRGLIA